MATLTVLKFSNPEGAQNMLSKIQSLQKAQLIKVQDAAIVTWPVGKQSPKTRQLVNLAGVGALQGAFWGMLFGMIFFVPFFGLAVGAAMGALSGKMADYGISDEFHQSFVPGRTPDVLDWLADTSGALLAALLLAWLSRGFHKSRQPG